MKKSESDTGRPKLNKTVFNIKLLTKVRGHEKNKMYRYAFDVKGVNKLV